MKSLSPDTDSGSAPAPLNQNEETSGSPRAVVVDDNEDSAEMLQGMLDVLGYQTRVAENGIDALRKISDFKPDLILMDIRMPKLNGYETCEVIRAQPWAQNVRVVAVTGQDQEQIGDRADKTGFDAYLIKPIEFDILKTLVTKPREETVTFVALDKPPLL